MRSDLIVELVKASVSGNDIEVRRTAEALAADETAKRHTGVADRITKALQATTQTPSKSRGRLLSHRSTDDNNGIARTVPMRPLSELYLEPMVQAACRELIEEQHRADVLRAHGLEPKHRLLLVGPPGNGKTSLAESVAYELGLPLLSVRYESVVTSYLGETAQRLKRLFDVVRTEPCVLFFDEFDAIGKERGDTHETGEIKRVVTTLLLQLDDLPPYCVLIGATNHPELLDRAAWRRFELKLELGKPSAEQFTAYFSDRFKELDGNVGYTAKRLNKEMKPTSFADAESFINDVKRRSVLAQGSMTLRSIMDDRVRVWRSRTHTNGVMNVDDRSTDPAIS